MTLNKVKIWYRPAQKAEYPNSIAANSALPCCDHERQTDDFDVWHLTRRSITFHDDHITLSLPSSKTEPFRQRVTLTIAEVDDSACAVASLQHLYK